MSAPPVPRSVARFEELDLVVFCAMEDVDCVGQQVGDGFEVLQSLDQIAYDIVLMDCHMPELDGFEATRQLRARGLRVPIIALTASAMDDERAHCFAVGMDDFLSKPLTAANLRAALDRLRPAA